MFTYNFCTAGSYSHVLEAGNNCFVAFYDVAKAFDSVWMDGLFRQVYSSGITGKTWRILYCSYVDFQCCVKIQGHFSDWYLLSRGIHQGGFLSLLKYTVFINSLLVQLKSSGHCCKIYHLPSAPIVYAYDLASGCVNEYKLNQVMRIVYRHGCTWRYEFNARKSGVLIYSQDQTHNRWYAPLREFRLGESIVSERMNYDHVGKRTSVNINDISGIEVRILKARKTLNAATGLGIRRNGLTIATCNIIFWSLVVPTALFGSEIWHLNNSVISLLEGFQNYAAKKIQRFYGRVPNACSLYALGWMRLERFIQVKKMMFIHAIMVLNDQTLSRSIFCERANVILGQGPVEIDESEFSVVQDLVKTTSLFNLLDDVRNRITLGLQYSKQTWKNKV